MAEHRDLEKGCFWIVQAFGGSALSSIISLIAFVGFQQNWIPIQEISIKVLVVIFSGPIAGVIWVSIWESCKESIAEGKKGLVVFYWLSPVYKPPRRALI